MGQENKQQKLDVQKTKLKALFNKMISVNIAIMEFQLTLTDKEEEIKGLKHFIKESEKAQKIINSIVHYEILVNLYNSFVNSKEIFYLTLVRTICKKDTIVKWDRTKKGFEEFLENEKLAKIKSEEEAKEMAAKEEMFRKAKEEGKKIEMVFVDGKLQPTIVDNEPN